MTKSLNDNTGFGVVGLYKLLYLKTFKFINFYILLLLLFLLLLLLLFLLLLLLLLLLL